MAQTITCTGDTAATEGNIFQKYGTKKTIALFAGLALGLLIGLCTPPEGLRPQAMQVLGILSCAIVWWIFNVFPEVATAFLMAMGMIGIAGVPTGVMLKPFSGATWWILVAAFGLGGAITRCGLLTRIALMLLNIFPKSYRGQIAGLIGVTTVTAPFIPSITARAAILAPLVLSISDAMGYERKGREATGLYLGFFAGMRQVAPLFISASVIGYALHGTLPPEVQKQFSMAYWFIMYLPWAAIVMLGNYCMLSKLYGPKSGHKVDMSFLPERIKALGPMGRQEKIMLCIISATILMWVSEPLHGIGSHVVAVAALALTLIFGIMDTSSFRSGIGWDSIFYIGIIIALAPVSKAVGIDAWLVVAFAPVEKILFANPFVMLALLAIMTTLVRFVIVSEIAYTTIFMTFLIPLALSAGINPWCVGVIIYTFNSPWIIPYQNSTYLSAYFAIDGQMVHNSETSKYYWVYFALCMVGGAVSIVLWKMLGLMP
jgi:DASS family divalent anion:Na+ symporter